jgi:hypothetical protein
MTNSEHRAEFIAQAWNHAYERAHPPGNAYDDAERAGRAAAKRWDAEHGLSGKPYAELQAMRSQAHDEARTLGHTAVNLGAVEREIARQDAAAGLVDKWRAANPGIVRVWDEHKES